jgi:hypothetical protein
MVLVNSDVTHVKEFLRILSTVWTCALKNVLQLFSILKECKDFLFEGAPNF